MDVAEFLHSLGVAPDYEIIKSPLPHVSLGEHFTPEVALGRIAMPSLSFQKLAGKALLEYLHHGRWRPLLRFADQQMEVFRHHYISDHDKTVAAAHLLEDFEKQGSTGGSSQHGTAMIATRSDEVQAVAPVVSFETFWHAQIVDSSWAEAL